MQKLGVLLLLILFLQLANASPQVVDFSSNATVFDGSFRTVYPGASVIYNWRVVDGDNLTLGFFGPENLTSCSFHAVRQANEELGIEQLEYPQVALENSSHNSATGRFSILYTLPAYGSYSVVANCSIEGYNVSAVGSREQIVLAEEGKITIVDDVNYGKIRGEGDKVLVVTNFTAPYAGSLTPDAGATCSFSLILGKGTYLFKEEPLTFDESIGAYRSEFYLNRTSGTDKYSFQAQCTALGVEDASESVSFTIRPSSCNAVELTNRSTKLQEEMVCSVSSGVLFNLTRNNSVFDCNGHAVRNLANSDAIGIIAAGLRNVTVQNCKFEGFSTGIQADNSSLLILRNLTFSGERSAFSLLGTSNVSIGALQGTYRGVVVNSISDFVSANFNGVTLNYSGINSSNMPFSLDDLVDFVTFGGSFIFVNSTANPNLSQEATITLANVQYSSDFKIMRDGIECVVPNCSKVSSNPVSFKVVGFSNYTTELIPVAQPVATPPSNGGGSSGSVDEIKRGVNSSSNKQNRVVPPREVEKRPNEPQAEVKQQSSNLVNETNQRQAPSGATGLFTLTDPFTNGGQATQGIVVIAAILLVAGYFAIVKK